MCTLFIKNLYISIQNMNFVRVILSIFYLKYYKKIIKNCGFSNNTNVKMSYSDFMKFNDIIQ